MSEPLWDDPADSAADRAVSELFAGVRPGPDLEARLIGRLRSSAVEPARPPSRWRSRLAWGVAASIAVGATAAGMGAIVTHGGLPFPGQGEEVAVHHGFVAFEPTDQPRSSLANQDFGLSNDLMAAVSIPRVEAANRLKVLTPPTAGQAGDGSALMYERRNRNESGEATYNVTAPSPTDPKTFYQSFQPLQRWDESFGKEKREKLGLLADIKAGTAVEYFDLPALAQSETDAKALKERFSEAPPRPEVRLLAQNPTVRGLPTVAQPAPADPAPAPPAAVRKVIIRSGDIEFEIDSFDSAVATVTQLVTAIPNAYVATVNSEKLANGKVKGSIAVRVPPEKLDGLVLDLRRELGKTGELKGQKIGSQDITKQYTDLESRLKAARTMETRLLEIIKTGKGEIKALLEAEKELGVWRTRIEELEGELRYYASQAALSSLTLVLAEKEIRAAAGLTESERVQAGVEVEDVEAAFRELLKVVLDAKGRVTKSELKQYAAGQFAASLLFELPPDAAGPVRDRLKQLGRLARLEIDRVTTANGSPTKDAKLTRGDTQFQVQLYNLANVAPRETVSVQVAAADVSAAYQTLRDAVERAQGRILTATLAVPDPRNVTATLDFEVKRADEPAVQAALAAAGEVLSRSVGRAADTDAVTDTKLRVTATLSSASALPPREAHRIGLEVENVDTVAGAYSAAVADAGGRVVEASINKEASGRSTGRFVYDVPLAAAGGVLEKLSATGTVRVRTTTRDPRAPDGKLATARLEVTASTSEPIVGKDDGLLPQVRKGLSVSAAALLASVSWLVVGLCVALPWAAVLWAGYRLVRRRRAG